jgi:hypothetical protein
VVVVVVVLGGTQVDPKDLTKHLAKYEKESFAAFYVYTTRADLKDKLTYSRPGVFALSRDVKSSLRNWAGPFETGMCLFYVCYANVGTTV